MQTTARHSFGKVMAGLLAFVPATKALACTACQNVSPTCYYHCDSGTNTCIVDVYYYDTCPPYDLCYTNSYTYGTGGCGSCPGDTGGRCV